jgi:serine protease
MKSMLMAALLVILASCTPQPRSAIGSNRVKPSPILSRSDLQPPSASASSFEEFRARVYKEPGPTGKFIVDGDTAIAGERKLREFFDAYIVSPSPVDGDPELAVNLVGGRPDLWSNTAKHGLTYCVSRQFGRRHAKVVLAMREAATAWEAAGDLRFLHASDQDLHCDGSNKFVIFDVRPVDVGGAYLARAFFPHESRATRNILVDASSFQLEAGKLTLAGILRHEVGHALGLRHEHARAESEQCFEDEDIEAVTPYDRASAMHYPQCGGLDDSSLELTPLDRNGIACLYGPAYGFVIDQTICKPRPSVNFITAQVRRSIRAAESVHIGRYYVAAGSAVRVDMASVSVSRGDGDLYVKLNGPVSLGNFDCRPMLEGSSEACDLDASTQVTTVDVMVRGIEAGDVVVSVRHIPHAGPAVGAP